jgi:hypothetical protein
MIKAYCWYMRTFYLVLHDQLKIYANSSRDPFDYSMSPARISDAEKAAARAKIIAGEYRPSAALPDGTPMAAGRS